MKIWTSLPLPNRLRGIVQRHRAEVLVALQKCGRVTGCQDASYRWMEVFKQNGVDGALVEGTFDDSNNPDTFNAIGHTWLELYLERSIAIFDSTVDQFRTRPREYKYTEHLRIEFDLLS